MSRINPISTNFGSRKVSLPATDTVKAHQAWVDHFNEHAASGSLFSEDFESTDNQQDVFVRTEHSPLDTTLSFEDKIDVNLAADAYKKGRIKEALNILEEAANNAKNNMERAYIRLSFLKAISFPNTDE